MLDRDRERRILVRRFQCTKCDTSFGLHAQPRARYSRQFAAEVVRRHVEGRESYRVIAKRLHEQTGRKISPTSLQKMVAEVGARCKTPLEMSRELCPEWEGFLLLDEKMCSVRGMQQWFYVAVDTSGDVVHCRPVNELTVTEALAFLTEIIATFDVHRKGIVTDLDTVLSRAVALVFARIPHQHCLKHALAAVEQLMGYRPWVRRRMQNRVLLREQFHRLPGRVGLWQQRAHDTFRASFERSRVFTEQFKRRETLHATVHSILLAHSEPQAQKLLAAPRLARQYDRTEQRKVVAFLQRHWKRLMAHHHCLGLPRPTNIIESFNKRLERRFKTPVCERRRPLRRLVASCPKTVCFQQPLIGRLPQVCR